MEQTAQDRSTRARAASGASSISERVGDVTRRTLSDPVSQFLSPQSKAKSMDRHPFRI